MQKKRRIDLGGIALAVVDEGSGPPVLLLHGFPDSSALWRHQLPALVTAGFRVIAPDLRGFGDSDRPEAVESYALRAVVSDILALLAALDVERAHVVGHDWGAAVAWSFAAFYPQRVERLAILSVGHPATYRKPSIEQREKSWYMLLFQFPDVAEELLRRDDWQLFRAFLRGAGDVDRYLADLSRPGALTAALAWYRANAAPRKELTSQTAVPAVAAPTLGIWSSEDRYLLEDAMLASRGHVTGGWRYERIDGASHWMQLDAPDRINALLVEFFTTADMSRMALQE